MCLDFTKASTLEVVGRDIAVLKLLEGSLWMVEAIRGIATWGNGFDQPRRINLCGLPVPSSQRFSVVLYLGEENMMSYLPHVLSPKIVAGWIFPQVSAGL